MAHITEVGQITQQKVVTQAHYRVANSWYVQAMHIEKR